MVGKAAKANKFLNKRATTDRTIQGVGRPALGNCSAIALLNSVRSHYV
ncbi:MAG: hypothetical protein WBL95_17165 [Microcoleus sp.]